MTDRLEPESLEILGQRLTHALYVSPAERRLEWRRPVGAVAVVAVVVVAVVFAVGSGTHVTAAAAALERAARGAQQSPISAPLRAGQFWYTRSVVELPVPISRSAQQMTRARTRSLQQGGMSLLIGGPRAERLLPVPGAGVEHVLSETWVSVDGTTRTRLTPLGRPRFATSRDQARFETSGTPSPGPSAYTQPGNGYFAAGDFTYQQLLELPTNPQVLYASLSHAVRTTQARRLPSSRFSSEDREQFAAQMLLTIASLLHDPLPTNVRAALYRAAALIPGARYDGKTYDLAHRTGVGVSVGGIEVIFNPTTGALLGQQAPGLGGAATETTVLSTGIANTINGRP